MSSTTQFAACRGGRAPAEREAGEIAGYHACHRTAREVSVLYGECSRTRLRGCSRAASLSRQRGKSLQGLDLRKPDSDLHITPPASRAWPPAVVYLPPMPSVVEIDLSKIGRSRHVPCWYAF